VPRHNFDPPRGRIGRLRIDSAALRGNLLGDPSERTVAVYLPPGHDEDGGSYPLLVGLSGFTGSGLKLLAWQAFGESVPQRIDRLVAEGRIGPLIAAFPDCFTSLGGNQYVNSIAMGNWEDFLLDEMLPRLESEFRVAPGPSHRAVFGRSSGGHGSLIQALRHGERWGAVACHSGDIGFENLFRPHFAKTLDALARHGGVGKFLDRVAGAVKVRGEEMETLLMLAMGASYDPDPHAPKGIRLPVDPHTCELIEERWSRWLEHDPLTLVRREECRARLRSLGALFLDCGSRDPYGLHYGARALSRELDRAGIPHRYEEFEDDHSGLDYRLDRSLPLLCDAIRL